jgi:hypothetical protein
MRIVSRLADRLVAAVVPGGKAAAAYWGSYCYCSGGYSYYQWCTPVGTAGTSMCYCQPRWCCGPYC